MFAFIVAGERKQARKRGQGFASKLNRFYLFSTVLKQLKLFNNPLPDRGLRTVWVWTALPDKQVPAELHVAQLGPQASCEARNYWFKRVMVPYPMNS